ncbi:putative porin [Herbaspirillum sp. Sphag1AN]|uniref:porin n=1 Tax=unclassified Herbaspirillum TaxID=2624150 RepID=UPI00160C00B4|nr:MULTISPECIES: porin [unclassified Herbaspirillum]MBB3213065.1 putative porin [Herbaspirillum sp. Sphag1AN]MBB3246262.1 putative porin [Herbaspirillum sp. Sphag64]
MDKTCNLRWISVVLALTATQAAWAENSSVTIYGVLDVFAGYQSTTIGGQKTNLSLVGNNGEMTSRIGFKGKEDLGQGYFAAFNLESGFDPSTGALQNSYRLFDRQAWVGLGGGFGEVRVGRQNTPMFNYAGNMDAFGAATYGSAFNNFANWLARVDNDISYVTPKFSNTTVELHYSPGERAGTSVGNAVYQLGSQTQQGPISFATAYLRANNATNTVSVTQLMAGGNYDYGNGKVYLAFFRTNDVISTTTGNALTNPAGKYDPSGSVVGNVAGNYHNVYGLSLDYRLTPALSVGGGGGYIQDSSSLDRNAKQFGLILNYDLSKRTRMYSVVSRLVNENGAAYKMTGASLTTSQALSPQAGASEFGFQLGIRHMF